MVKNYLSMKDFCSTGNGIKNFLISYFKESLYFVLRQIKVTIFRCFITNLKMIFRRKFYFKK